MAKNYDRENFECVQYFIDAQRAKPPYPPPQPPMSAGRQPDNLLLDLEIANLSRAIADGGLGARWELGAAVARVLTARKDDTQ